MTHEHLKRHASPDVKQHVKRGRPGSALLWVVAMTAIFAAILAAMAGNLSDINDLQRVQETARILRVTRVGVDSFTKVVARLGATHQTPGHLVDLTTAIANG